MSIEHYYETGELFDGRYKLLRPLSTEGGTADVWLATDMNTIDAPTEFDEDDVVYVNGERIGGKDSGEGETGMQVAIKIYRPKNALDIEGEQRFRDEFKIVYNCHHANLLQPSHFSIFNEVPYLVLPFCRDGSAEKLIENKPDNDTLWKFVFDVASGLAYLHACTPPIIHQDVKPANVLIDSHRNFAITDFGISAKFGGNQHTYGYDDGNMGTLAYMAPERFEPEYIPTAPGDIWGLGATLYEIITSQVPFGEEGGAQQPDGPVNLQFPKDTDPSLQRLICACLAKNPDERPTAEVLIEAGRQQQFPIKKPSAWPKVLGAILAVAAIAALVWAFVFRPEPVTIVKAPPTRPAEEVFAEAKALLAYDHPDSLAAGLALMDSLGAQKYVPALWEMALTYGWFSDEESVRRKQVMGIEVGNTNVAQEAQALAPYLPKLDEYNQKAMSLFARIVESGDTVNLGLKAKAAYTLGIYYVYYTRNMTLALKQFQKGRTFAVQQNDTEMIDNFDAAIQQIK